ncbi:uncharacterized protein BDR25DRAFT_347629 [Lindgomyces ingoldianus]|uniref:Uncharacterized protein n=1 Tax=Lindgomyces ingoldianus TaxID=673940 RepID=A0ACB6Q752_9PLEO|nr:uncharacterized protein BDR25DRAFT_347629 [Lindgomyces ingoldianus]KAF2462718.1 hypothetical protein BDR25DRAFT_347629 [Lindgomyces ingoldianus]
MADIPACRRARFDIIDLSYRPSRGKSFFPLDCVRDYLTEERIKEILCCVCDQCKTHRKYFNGDEPLQYQKSIMGEPRTKERLDNRKHNLFALLIYVEHPVLIMGFAERGKTDWFLEVAMSWFNAENIKLCTGDYSIYDQKSFSRFVTEFIKHLPEFSVPHMESGDFTHYDDGVILPFIEEEEIGQRIDKQARLASESKKGKVIRFKIYKAYQRFPHASTVTWFARKKIESLEMQFYLEKTRLGFADDFKNPHIVKLIKAYRIGDSVNLIMPLARTNLAHLLREPALQYGETREGPPESCNAWVQLLGVANALRQISALGEQDSVRVRLCMHLDLKPENILIDDDGNWVITDIGQAALTYGNGRTPRDSETNAYAPPEIDNPTLLFGPKYDVWSLGCIFLEVTAFVVRGYAGLSGSSPPAEPFEGLDSVRKAGPSWAAGRSDERFFYQDSYLSEPVVKREIITFMQNLENRAVGGDRNSETSQAFCRKILHLITRMLKPNVDDRIDIAEVVRILSDAIEQANFKVTLGRGAAMEPASGETRVGGPQLSSLSLWHYSVSEKRWEAASLEAFESETGGMRLGLWKHQGNPYDIAFLRGHVKILPLYAFWLPDFSETSKAWIQLSFLTHGPVSMVANTEFSFSGIASSSALDAAHLVQSTLTSQTIEGCFTVESVELKRVVPLGGKIWNKGLRLIGSSKAGEKAKEYVESLDLGSATVHLWVEKADEAADRLQGTHTSSSQETPYGRQPRLERHYSSTYKELPPRRVVLYLHHSRFICTIKIDVNWVLDVEGDDPDPCVLLFKPNQPQRDPHFVASWLRPTPEEQADHVPAGIPLSPPVLRYMENHDRFEADRFKVRFRSPEECWEFQQKYRIIKKAWDLERLELEKTQGYTPMNRRPVRKQHSDSPSIISITTPKHRARFPVMYNLKKTSTLVNGVSDERALEISRPVSPGATGSSQGFTKKRNIQGLKQIRLDSETSDSTSSKTSPLEAEDFASPYALDTGLPGMTTQNMLLSHITCEQSCTVEPFRWDQQASGKTLQPMHIDLPTNSPHKGEHDMVAEYRNQNFNQHSKIATQGQADHISSQNVEIDLTLDDSNTRSEQASVHDEPADCLAMESTLENELLQPNADEKSFEHVSPKAETFNQAGPTGFAEHQISEGIAPSQRSSYAPNTEEQHVLQVSGIAADSEKALTAGPPTDSGYASRSRGAESLAGNNVPGTIEVPTKEVVEGLEADDDILSVASDGFDIQSEGSVETLPVEVEGKLHLARLLATDPDLGPVCKAVLSRMDRHRFIDAARKLLKAYYRNLLENSKTEREKRSVALLKSRRGRTRIGAVIAHIVQTEDIEPEERLRDALEESRNRAEYLNTWIAKMPQNIGPAVAPPLFHEEDLRPSPENDENDELGSVLAGIGPNRLSGITWRYPGSGLDPRL